MKKNLILLIIAVITFVIYFYLGSFVQTKKTESIINNLKIENQSLKEKISILEKKDCPSKFCDKPEGCERNFGVVTLKGEPYGGSDEEAANGDTRLNKEQTNLIVSAIPNEEETKHPIDIEEEKCINSKNPYLYSDCAKQSEISWNMEIEKYLKHINQIMDSDNIKIITESQLNWEKSAQSDKKMINKFISSRQGAINETLGFSYISEIKKQRAILLKNIYENYKEELEFQQYQ